MNETRFSLCPNCDACPEVVIAEDAVTIGEEGNKVRLTVDEWNVLVDAVRTGALSPVSDSHNNCLRAWARLLLALPCCS